jgi:hypothetical protein
MAKLVRAHSDADRGGSAAHAGPARAGPIGRVTVDEETAKGSAARLLAVEVLLAEPELLGDDVLESCLYILRDRMRGADDGDDEG